MRNTTSGRNGHVPFGTTARLAASALILAGGASSLVWTLGDVSIRPQQHEQSVTAAPTFAATPSGTSSADQAQEQSSQRGVISASGLSTDASEGSQSSDETTENARTGEEKPSKKAAGSNKGAADDSGANASAAASPGKNAASASSKQKDKDGTPSKAEKGSEKSTESSSAKESGSEKKNASNSKTSQSSSTASNTKRPDSSQGGSSMGSTKRYKIIEHEVPKAVRKDGIDGFEITWVNCPACGKRHRKAFTEKIEL